MRKHEKIWMMAGALAAALVTALVTSCTRTPTACETLAACADGPCADECVQGDSQALAVGDRLALGHYHTCAVLDTGDLRCWGYAGNGALGYASTTTIGDNEHPSAAGFVQYR